MDKTYADTVRLLLTVAPEVFRNDFFAMKGGTAINLFVRDMPRLSVDLDVAYIPWDVPRDNALAAISGELSLIAKRLAAQGYEVRTIADMTNQETKLLISEGALQVKVEVNHVFRGSVLPIERLALVEKAATMFAAELELPVLAVDELYGGKLVAALDRQHPRDLFDVWKLYEAGGLSDGMVECCVTYLAGHGRPTHEVLFANQKDIKREYESTFAGMTLEPAALQSLLAVRDRLFHELPKKLTDKQRRFLIGFTRLEPDWTLLECMHAAKLPALQWKLLNLERFKKTRPAEFERQAEVLELRLVDSE